MRDEEARRFVMRRQSKINKQSLLQEKKLLKHLKNETFDNNLICLPYHYFPDLQKALKYKEFVLHYQPKVNLLTGEIVGVEALIRWNHPEWGNVPPADFIPIAEYSGLIAPIGEWVLKTACLQNKKWHSTGFPLVMSVNLSLRQLTLGNFVQTVKNILIATKLDPSFLEFEITESATTNSEQTIAALNEIKRFGVKISIDDFGTGFNPLHYLHQFPIDTLKIDQSFIREIHNRKKDNSIIKNLFSLAHSLQLNVVAEGIETIEQLLFLQQHKCTEGQGYLFSKPMTASELEGCFIDLQKTIKKFGIGEENFGQLWAVNDKNNKVICKKIVERKKQDEMLVKAKKLEIVGELAAGIAHEIRNPLTAMKGFIQLLEQGGRDQDYFKYIYSAFNDIEQFIDELVLIGKPLPIEPENVNMIALIEESLKQIKHKGEGKQIQLDQVCYGADILEIMCDPRQISSVIQQIVLNSMEAVADEGRINISTIKDEDYLVVRVTDNGTGMTKERLDKLGEPYFSIKEKGTGFGLMTCYQIMLQHNGTISVESEVEKGTSVELRFPTK